MIADTQQKTTSLRIRITAVRAAVAHAAAKRDRITQAIEERRRHLQALEAQLALIEGASAQALPHES